MMNDWLEEGLYSVASLPISLPRYLRKYVSLYIPIPKRAEFPSHLNILYSPAFDQFLHLHQSTRHNLLPIWCKSSHMHGGSDLWGVVSYSRYLYAIPSWFPCPLARSDGTCRFCRSLEGGADNGCLGCGVMFWRLNFLAFFFCFEVRLRALNGSW